MKNNENGRSMVEMLGVLAIIGVLSAGGLAGYSKAMFKHKLNSTMEQITMLVTNIRTMYGTQGNYDGLSNSTAVNLGAVPAIMGTGDTLTSPFKGEVHIKMSTTDGTTILANTNSEHATAFVVTYGNLPKEACIALATADFGSGAGSGFIGTAASDTSTEGAPDAQALAAALTVGGASEGKALTMGGNTGAIATCSTEDNSVAWKFY
ncbi:MAG: hypothetical protein J6X42_02905 [Alphaproteobacteria bacterium]|nr:hypothetical protein [Alphaproteobacteria bacterium]